MDFSNEFFQGGVGLMILGGIIAGLAYLPKVAWNLLQRWLTTTAYVRDQQLVIWIADWLQETERGEPRWWMAEINTAVHDQNKDADPIVLKPGQGLHIMHRFGRRLLIWSWLEDNGILGKIHTITMRTYGRDPSTIKRVIDAARDLAVQRVRGKNQTFINNIWGDWQEIRLGAPRPLWTIVLNGALLEEIRGDLASFLQSREVYRARGIPYRRGYLLQGEPGNGKSTLVQGLATEFELPIYSLTISDKDFSDARLARALGLIPPRAILLLEDADRIDFDRTGVTLPGLLNAIDGALASEGRVLIVTANHPERLDAAFTREGRMDRNWRIEKPSEDSIRLMGKMFHPDASAEDLARFTSVAWQQGWSMARVQNELSKFHSESEPELAEA